MSAQPAPLAPPPARPPATCHPPLPPGDGPVEDGRRAPGGPDRAHPRAGRGDHARRRRPGAPDPDRRHRSVRRGRPAGPRRRSCRCGRALAQGPADHSRRAPAPCGDPDAGGPPRRTGGPRRSHIGHPSRRRPGRHRVPPAPRPARSGPARPRDRRHPRERRHPDVPRDRRPCGRGPGRRRPRRGRPVAPRPAGQHHRADRPRTGHARPGPGRPRCRGPGRRHRPGRHGDRQAGRRHQRRRGAHTTLFAPSTTRTRGRPWWRSAHSWRPSKPAARPPSGRWQRSRTARSPRFTCAQSWPARTARSCACPARARSNRPSSSDGASPARCSPTGALGTHGASSPTRQGPTTGPGSTTASGPLTAIGPTTAQRGSSE